MRAYFTLFCLTCNEKTVHEVKGDKSECLVCRLRQKGVLEMMLAYKEAPKCHH